jgi:hypothetical protein
LSNTTDKFLRWLVAACLRPGTDVQGLKETARLGLKL